MLSPKRYKLKSKLTCSAQGLQKMFLEKLPTLSE